MRSARKRESFSPELDAAVNGGHKTGRSGRFFSRMLSGNGADGLRSTANCPEMFYKWMSLLNGSSCFIELFRVPRSPKSCSC